jgi:hypothetical protein
MKPRTAVLTSVTLFCANLCLADTVVVTADLMVDVVADRSVARPQITITDGRITAVSSQDAPARQEHAVSTFRGRLGFPD